MFLRVVFGFVGIFKFLFMYGRDRRLLNRVILSWGNGLRSKEIDYIYCFLLRGNYIILGE